MTKIFDVYVYNENNIASFLIWSIMLLLMFWHAKEAE